MMVRTELFIDYVDYIRLTYQRTLDGGDGYGSYRALSHHKASNADAVWELHTNGNIGVYQPNNGNVFFSRVTPLNVFICIQ